MDVPEGRGSPLSALFIKPHTHRRARLLPTPPRTLEAPEYVVAIEKETLAETHPSRLALQHALVGAYKASGQIR